MDHVFQVALVDWAVLFILNVRVKAVWVDVDTEASNLFDFGALRNWACLFVR